MNKKIKTVNSISGGESSGLMEAEYPADYSLFALVCLDDLKCAPKDKDLVKWVNDKLGENYIKQFGEFIATAEDDRTLYAMRDLEQLTGREIIWVRGDSFDTIINKRYHRVLLGHKARLPSWARRWCTEEMKLIPIFLWWFYNIGEKVKMRIGFRFDEFNRLENFYNNSDPNNFSIPVACSTIGQKLQRHTSFNWRDCTFPLIRDGITKPMVKSYWKGKYVQKGFEYKRIEYPEISNCAGCFHKKEDTLCVQWNINTAKMDWFARQEDLGMGTWLDSRIRYDSFKEHALSATYSEDIIRGEGSCDSGGCTN